MKYTINLVAMASVVLAQTTHDVDVGPLNDGSISFIFKPDTITAAMGDTINFHFYNPGSHSVAQAAFNSPCQYMDGGLWSGFFMNPPMGESSMMYSVVMNSTDPVWLYCATGDHCQDGMVAVINPPSSGNTLQSFKQAASSAGSNMPPSDTQTVVGGQVVANEDNDDDDDEGSSSMPSSSSMMGGSSSPTMSSSAGMSSETGAAGTTKAPAAAMGLAGAIAAWWALI